MRRERVVVIGMHRGGTSATTRVLNLLGLPVCTDLYQGQHNATGYWESASLIALNDELLGTFSGPWWEAMPPHWEQHIDAELIDRCRDAFKAAHPTESWVWKDPRLCLLMPLWRQVLEPIVVVLVLRDPAPSAASLAKRQRWPIQQTIELWHTYMHAAVDGIAGLPAVVLRYEDLQRDPHSTITALRSDLRTLGVDLRGDGDAAAASITSNLGTSRARTRLPRHVKRTVRMLNQLRGPYPVFPELQ